jgi:hypothetical protein
MILKVYILTDNHYNNKINNYKNIKNYCIE